MFRKLPGSIPILGRREIDIKMNLMETECKGSEEGQVAGSRVRGKEPWVA
jgi:hypothetical protein